MVYVFEVISLILIQIYLKQYGLRSIIVICIGDIDFVSIAVISLFCVVYVFEVILWIETEWLNYWFHKFRYIFNNMI